MNESDFRWKRQDRGDDSRRRMMSFQSADLWPYGPVMRWREITHAIRLVGSLSSFAIFFFFFLLAWYVEFVGVRDYDYIARSKRNRRYVSVLIFRCTILFSVHTTISKFP